MNGSLGRIRNFSDIDQLYPEYDENGDLIPIEEKITYQQDIFKDDGISNPYSDGEKLLFRLALTQLTDMQRKIIQAVFFDGKSQQSLAEDLSISQQAVSKHHDYALKKIRKICLG